MTDITTIEAHFRAHVDSIADMLLDGELIQGKSIFACTVVSCQSCPLRYEESFCYAHDEVYKPLIVKVLSELRPEALI